MDKEIVWLVRGKQRRELFSNLPENHFIPNRLRRLLNETKGSNLSLREVSRHLRDFEERDIIKCINKKDPYNKIYYLTEKGKRLKVELSKSKL